MKKYTNTDGKAKVLSPEAHKVAQEALHKQGKVSARDLNDADREKFTGQIEQ